MAKALKTIGMIAGAVALVATGVGAFAVAGSALAATAGSVAAIATVTAGVANIGAQALYKPPPARGSLTRIIISPDAPQPYMMGEGYCAGVLRHDTAYGATLKKVPNPYRWMVAVYSGGGPIDTITPYVDQGAVGGYYSGFLSTDTQLGACPESTALVPPLSAPATGWDSASKLSGQAAIGWNLKFDKEGKVFASGVPQLGAHGKWVKAYDPRLDSTFPGGSGAHRLDDETTWEWTENPALHAGTYAYGRYQNGKRTIGCGLPTEAINWTQIAAWANVCDANDWAIFGAVYEPMPDTRWPNLLDICAAGGCRPIVVGGVVNFHYQAPRVALDTFTEDDLAEGPGSVTAMRGRRERLNTIVPKFRDPASNWELVPAGDAVTSSTYVTEDGEERVVEWPFNLVKDKDQAAELAAYTIADSRELQPIVLTFGHRVRAYKPGDCVTLEIPSLALDTDAVILTREFDPGTLRTTFTFIGETAAKHAWALGQTVAAPPTPGLSQTGEDRDDVADGAGKPYGWQVAVIRTATVKNPRDTSDVARSLLIATDVGASATISVARHDWDYPDGTTDVTRELDTITGLSFATEYSVYFDDADLTDTSPTYHATTDPAEALNSSDHPDRHPLGKITTPADGAAATTGAAIPGYGYPEESSVPGWIEDAANNFNDRSHRLTITPTAIGIPSGGACINHTAGADGSIDLYFNWTFGGTKADQSGFEVGLYASTSGSAYTPGTTPASEDIFAVSINKLAAIWRGLNPTLYYTPFIRTYRDADPDAYDTWAAANTSLAATTAKPRIVSAWVKSTVSGENPYLPSANVTLTSADLTGTLNGGTMTTAAVIDGADRAASAINTDYTIKNGKVVTASVASNAINDKAYALLTTAVGLSASDTYTEDAATVTVTSGFFVTDWQVSFYLEVTNPTFNSLYSITFTPRLKHIPSGTYADGEPVTYEERWLGATTAGTFNFPTRVIEFGHRFVGVTNASHSASIQADTPSTNGAWLPRPRRVAGEDTKAIK